MAPSSTPYGGSRRELLAARDARQAALELRLRGGHTTVALSLAIPGPVKAPPGSDALFEWAAGELRRALPGARAVHAARDALGPFALWAVPAPPREVKACCVAIEGARPAARLVDLDVYAPGGAPVDRASLGLPARTCVCCRRPAHECVRTRRHDPAAVVARALDLLAGA